MLFVRSFVSRQCWPRSGRHCSAGREGRKEGEIYQHHQEDANYASHEVQRKRGRKSNKWWINNIREDMGEYKITENTADNQIVCHTMTKASQLLQRVGLQMRRWEKLIQLKRHNLGRTNLLRQRKTQLGEIYKFSFMFWLNKACVWQQWITFPGIWRQNICNTWCERLRVELREVGNLLWLSFKNLAADVFYHKRISAGL